MKTISEIRQDFIDFYRENGHKYLAPSKIFIEEDKTLFFVNAGMNQLKDYFLGIKKPDDNYKQLVNSQICLRAGGHKCDIEEVGDKTHNTLFEMLGQWSLGSYTKEVAIKLAFEFITEKCKLNPEQIYITYFEGNEELKPDLETKELWEKYVPKERILPGSYEDNFWSMDNTGPCGACTEIHYDLIGDRLVPELVNKDDLSVVEIWNLVFTEYNKDKTGYNKLDNLYIDTGMGLERLSMIVQGKNTIYQTDAFRYLIGYCQALTNGEFYTDSYGNEINNITDKAYRTFADHIRTVVYSLYDGVDFDTTKRGFVLRKIFRRLLTYLYIYLNKGHIQPVFNRSIVMSMISDILIFFGKKKHNADEIHSQLIKEEKLFIGKITHVKQMIHNGLKKNNNKQELYKKLHEEKGIPLEILENVDNITFGK
jgi:alanyl-tRNA synthetase